MALPIAVSGVVTPENEVTLCAVVHKQESRHKVPKSVLRAVLGRIQLTLHATRRTSHGASRLVQAMSAWLVKTRRAPSRQSRDARVYGQTTTAMHKLSTPPPPPAPPPLLCTCPALLGVPCARVAWRKDGKRLASASDDRTVRVWNVELCGVNDGTVKKPVGRLVWTGWGHVSRVWDVGFSSVGVVTCGEVRNSIPHLEVSCRPRTSCIACAHRTPHIPR